MGGNVVVGGNVVGGGVTLWGGGNVVVGGGGNVVPGCQQYCSALLHLTGAYQVLTILFNIVDNQGNSIVASCFQQPLTAHNFWPCSERTCTI